MVLCKLGCLEIVRLWWLVCVRRGGDCGGCGGVRRGGVEEEESWDGEEDGEEKESVKVEMRVRFFEFGL